MRTEALHSRNPEVAESVRLLGEYLKLGGRFENPPVVKLMLMSQAPQGEDSVGARDVVGSTAIQCYSPGLSLMMPRVTEKELRTIDDTLDAGHHTTRQHVHYAWRVDGMSRSTVHDSWHMHPFYNSEQQSQRYVEAKKGSFIVPTGLSGSERELYVDAADYANTAYFELLKLLHPKVTEVVGEIYPSSGWKVEKTADRLIDKAQKVSQEVARYVLPVGQKTNFYHTLSELQILRMFRSLNQPQVNDETRYVVARMIEEVASVDGQIIDELRVPLPESSSPSWARGIDSGQRERFDEQLGGRLSVLDNLTSSDVQTMVDSARNVIGVDPEKLSDEDILMMLLDPGRNELLADVFDTGMMHPFTASLRQINLRFLTRVSHTADSQRQRHRRTFGTSPSLTEMYDGTADYIVPLIVRNDEELREAYERVMERVYGNVLRSIEAGVPEEYALMLLPNAHAIRVVESGDLFDWMHRWRQRLCYLAQEEIFFVSVEQVKQVLETIPEAANSLQAPCGLRQVAGIRPRCPEGSRWCGKPVFNWDLDQYEEGRFI